MIIEAYDLATHTGMGSVDTAGPIAPVWSWERWKLTTSSMDAQALVLFEARLRERFRARRPDIVVYELVEFMKYRLAYQVYARLSGILIMTCEKVGIEHHGVPVKTVKAFARSGSATKIDMMRAARERLFGEIIPQAMPDGISEDEVDGLWMAAWAAERFAGVMIP